MAPSGVLDGVGVDRELMDLAEENCVAELGSDHLGEDDSALR